MCERDCEQLTASSKTKIKSGGVLAWTDGMAGGRSDALSSNRRRALADRAA